VLVDLPSQRVPKVEAGGMQIRIDHNLSLPDAGQNNIGVESAVSIGIPSSSDRIWASVIVQYSDTDVRI
jgi:hypothetical protein